MFKYRDHKGGFAESMATTKHMLCFDDLKAHIKSIYGDGLITVKRYCQDPRNGWNTHLVSLDGGAVGFTDSMVEGFSAGRLIKPLEFEKRIEEFKLRSNELIKKSVAEFLERAVENAAIGIVPAPIRANELLYDKNGLAVAIKINGEILAILEGDE